MSRVLVLDFDGTMTDAEREGAPFTAAYLEDVAALVARPVDEVRALADAFVAELAADAASDGWTCDGKVVAPASVDPYLRIQPVARRIFDRYGAFTQPEERDRLLDAVLYKHNYGKTAIAFKPGAREALEALADTETHVITNSHTEAVQHKIRVLGETEGAPTSLEWLAQRVHGRAQKYRVDDAFTSIAPHLALEGLDRPVLLRRRLYHDAIVGLLERAGADWSDLVVVGDIFELDLALPLAMGARVGLMVNEFTPAYEVRFLMAHDNAAILESVAEIPGFAGL